MPEPVSEAAVDAALAASDEWVRRSRSVVFTSPARDQVRAMLKGALSSLAAGSDPETLGRAVRETWVNWALEQPDVADHPSWTKPWDELAGRDREVDMRIGAAVAVQAVADAGIVRAQLAAEVIRLRGRLEAVARECERRGNALAPGVERTAWLEAAGVALAAREGQERSDEKEPS